MPISNIYKEEVTRMTEEVKTERTTKKYLTVIPRHLWEQMIDFQQKHNNDSRNVGSISVNNLMLTSVAKFLDKAKKESD
jgi:hypothetical protein